PFSQYSNTTSSASGTLSPPYVTVTSNWKGSSTVAVSGVASSLTSSILTSSSLSSSPHAASIDIIAINITKSRFFILKVLLLVHDEYSRYGFRSFSEIHVPLLP